MKDADIRLEKAIWDNVDDIVKLRVSKEQKGFVAGNKASLIDAYLTLAEGGQVFPFGIYSAKTPVGFIMISYSNDWSGYGHDAWINSDEFRFYRGRNYYYIRRFMIDRRYQGRGYGRKALERAIGFVRSFPCGDAEYCILSYEPKNEAARRLYGSCGFKEFDPSYNEEGDEVSALLKL